MNPLDERRECHLEVNSADDAPALLGREAGLSKGEVKRAMARGAVWLERGGSVKRLRRAGRVLRPGDRLHFYYDPVILAAEPPPARLLVDEGAWSAWYKPPGMFSQGSRWGDHCSMVRWAETHLEPRRNAFLVHRLDRAASGLMLVAHTKGAARLLAGLFRERAIRKFYRVVVHGRFPDEELLFTAELDGRPARTRARLLKYDAERERSLLQVEIQTGRKHQIRRHLSGAGFPVVGDRLHGRDAKEDLRLQAVRLLFEVDGREWDLQLPPGLQLALD